MFEITVSSHDMLGFDKYLKSAYSLLIAEIIFCFIINYNFIIHRWQEVEKYWIDGKMSESRSN